jgi:hypothetical protein
MLKPGTVLFDTNFVFKDGERGKKLIVLLNSPKTDEDYIVLKTTSQPKRYTDVKDGCNENKKVFFVPFHKKEIFDIDTYIQLHEIYPLPADDVSRKLKSKTIISLGCLSNLGFRQLINCIKKLRKYIPECHYNTIINNAKSM